MPIYDFVCAGCGHRFEQRCTMTSDSPVNCPSCGSSHVTKLVSMPGPVNATSRPQDGRTCCGRSERCDKPPCSSGGQCHR